MSVVTYPSVNGAAPSGTASAFSTAITTSHDVGAVPAATLTAGVVVSEQGDGNVHKTVFTLTDVALTLTDAGAAGAHGSLQLYDFPAGNLLFLGGTSDLAYVKASGGIAATTTIVAAVGSATAGVDNEALADTEADLIPSTSAAMVASAGTSKGKSLTAGVVVFDGTATAKDAWLNVTGDATGMTANGVLTVNGTITLVWNNLGDN